MSSELILVLSALVCAIGVAAFVACGIKYRNEGWVFYLVIGAIVCASSAAWCIQEAVKRADAQQNPPSVKTNK
jgi:hypothetical protein